MVLTRRRSCQLTASFHCKFTTGIHCKFTAGSNASNSRNRLLGPEQRWDEDEAQAFADEYDTYLIEAAGLLRRGTSDQDVVELLVTVETAHMGLALQPDTYERARSTVAAIKADKDLWTPSE